MNIVLFGPPGSGKGTQGEKLVKKFNLFKFSAGDLLRNEIEIETDLGKEIKSTIEKGKLVSNNIINKLVEKTILNKKYNNRIVFDGYPRNLDQAKNLDFLLKKYYQKISQVISLKINKETVVKRLLGRQTCSKCHLTFNKFFNPPKKEDYECGLKYLKTRADDNEKTINDRYETYKNETTPILEYYKNQNILREIDGTKEIDTIYSEILGFIDSLET